MNCKHFWLAATAFVLFCATNDSIAQDDAWYTGSELDRQSTNAAMSVNWREAPLRVRLNELAQRQKIGIFLDRRVDGSQLIKFRASDVAFEEFLWRLCEKLDIGMCRLEDVYYVGPKSTAARLPEMLEDLKTIVRETSGRRKDKWKRRSKLNIERLTEPVSLLDAIANNLNFQVSNIEVVPHDLWGECFIPNCSGTAKMALLLAGFELSFQPNADLTSISLQSITSKQLVIREFRTGQKTNSLFELINDAFPDHSIVKNRRSITATGDESTILQIDRIIASSYRPEVASLSKQRFSMKGQTTRKLILQEISQSLNRQLDIPDWIEPQLEARINLDVKDVTIESLIATSLEGTNLDFQITDSKLVIQSR